MEEGRSKRRVRRRRGQKQRKLQTVGTGGERGRGEMKMGERHEERIVMAYLGGKRYPLDIGIQFRYLNI
jgi:hypothetical protein